MCRRSLLLATIVLCATVRSSLVNERAPQITTMHPESEIPYMVGKEITLPCQAVGSPVPKYSWRKNGVKLPVNLPHYTRVPGSGNLVIKSPTEFDGGEYNCLASNRLGTSVGMKLKVKRAVLEAFPTVTEPTLLTPVIGESLKITCTPPHSYPNPRGSTYFSYDVNGSTLENIVYDNRVLLDYEGNLYFANVIANDSLLDKNESANYLCVVNNALVGAFVQGNDHKLRPRTFKGMPEYRPVHLMWPLTSTTVAIKGQTKTLKCIFGGLPTPTVAWHSDKESSRFVVTDGGHGTEISFDNVDLQDEGFYTCSGSNSPSGSPVTHRIRMIVQSPPFWRRKPVDLNVDEDSDIKVDCSVAGTPNPTVEWMINGIPVNESHFSGRKSLFGNKLRYGNVTVNDSQVIQCMAANEHGSILTNVILKVNAEPPSFMETPAGAKVVQRTSVELKCNSRGAPKPVIFWTRGKPPHSVSGPRFIVHPSGTLEIQNTELEDTDDYYCHALNKHGTNDASAELIVRSPTVIRSVPTVRVVEATEEVEIPCNASTDPAETTNLVVEWRKGGESIDFDSETHMYVKADHSLHIKSSKVRDTAGYTCNASNGIDEANSANFQLKVKARPDPPHDVRIFLCGAEKVGLSWRTGSDNNDPITAFTVHYNNSYSNQTFTRIRETGEVFRLNEQFNASVDVRPWSRYTFYVTASNSLGRSRPSGPDGKECKTLQLKPYRNPSGVCGTLKSPSQLVIIFEPLPENEYNAEGFYYIVRYKRRGRWWESVRTEYNVDPKLRSVAIPNQPSFQEYEISVQSANKMGYAPLKEEENKLTYSGEGKPRDAPRNFRLGEHMNGSYAEFIWDSVDTSQDRIQGFFRGYLIELWRTEEPNIVRTEEVIIDMPFELCPSKPEDLPHTVEPPAVGPSYRRRRFVRSPSSVRGATSKIWPSSRISAAVRVLSQQQVGDRSNVIEFNSPEGEPGSVSSLKVTERGSGHLLFEWQLPVDASGPIWFYEVEYRVGEDAKWQRVDPDDACNWVNITNLKANKYEVRIVATTGEGDTVKKTRSRVCMAYTGQDNDAQPHTPGPCTDKFCDNETDTKYSIHWNRTIAGTNSSEPCPWNPTGWCSRECLPNTIWSQPTCNSCADKKFNDFFVRVNTLNLTALDNQNVTAKIASDLSTATNNSEGLTPGNLKASVELIKLLSDAIQRNDSNATINEMEIKSIVKAASNVLRPNNSESWETLKKENQNIATSILLSLDNYGRSLAALNISENRKEEENLILEAWSFEKSNLREIEFPSRSLWDEDRGDGISISVEALQSSMLSVRPTLKMWGSYYRTVNEYLPGHKDTDVVNSRVLSFSIDGLKTNEELKRPVIITLRHNQENRTGFQRKCAFWNFGSGTWDFDGCSVTLTNRTHTICSCNHLTNFAILMSLTPKEEDKLLNLISVIGCSISAAALILTILIYALTWKQSKSAQATVLLNLCVALASAYLIFLAGADKFEEEKYQKDGCTAVAVLLHYFFLAAFFIMLIEGVELVLYIIFVFHVRRTRETIMLIVSAWVLPLIIVGVSLGSTRFDGYGHKNACWLSAEKGLIWAFIGPVLFIVTANFVILIVVLSWMSQKKALLAKNGKKRDEIRATIWNLSVTCPVLGLGWLFGVLSLISDHVGFQYLFVIVNSLQGLLIFIFHALFHNKKMNEKISSFYSNYICRCRKSKLSVSTQITSAQEQSTSTTAASKATIEMTSAQEQSTSTTAASKATTEMTSAQEQSTSSILALTSTTEISPAQEQSTSSTPALTTTTEMTLAQDQATSSTSVTKVSTEMSSAQEQSTRSTRASASTAEVTSSQEQSTSSTSTSKVTTEMSSDQEQSTSSTSAKDSSAANKKPTDKAKVVPRAVKYYEDLIGRAGQFAQRCSAAYDQWRL